MLQRCWLRSGMSEHPSLSSTARRAGRLSRATGAASRWASAALLTGAALALGLHPLQAKEVVLYILNTRCALKGAAPVPCKVVAVDEQDATLYRHIIGANSITLRISDEPARLSLMTTGATNWKPLRNAAVRFSTNTLCLDDESLCVVNPNYLNSLLQERPDFRERDLVRVHFDAKGRVDLICYDTGCDLLAEKRQAN